MAVVVLCAIIAVPVIADPSRLRVEAFARLPEYVDMDLSPDGTRLAAIVNRNGETVVYTRSVADSKINPLVSTDNHTYRINWIRWANNDYLAISLRFPSQVLAARGADYMSSRMMIVKWNDPSTIRPLFTPAEDAPFIPQFQDRVVDWLADEDDWIALAIDLDQPGSLSLYRFRISKEERKVLHAASRGRIVDWVLDEDHVPRVYVNLDKAEYRVFYRRAGEDSYSLGWKYEALSDQEVTPLGFSSDPNLLYVTAYKDGFRALFSVDLARSDLPMTLVHARSRSDVSERLIRSVWRGGAVGVLSPTDESSYHLWDTEYAAFDAAINRALPDTRNYIVDMSDDGEIYLLYVISGDSPGRYFYGNRSTKQVSVIASSYPMLDGLDLPEMKRVEYTARDGTEIEAFLTLPAGAGEKRLPTILFPHGGPISATTDHFDYWTQFFANRGYAVFQMNFRGSSGYGYDFLKSGLKGWGLQMQDDISDGLSWLIEEGVTDPGRVCIVGGSYGGYAALMGAVKSPTSYRCAVSFAGISDIEMLVKNSKQYSDHEVVERMVGDLKTDREQMRSTSPRRQAEKIVIPVLLAHGSDDRVVPIEQSEVMAEALEKAGKTVKFMVFEGGDHYLSKEQHRLSFFRIMDLFLAQHLATPVEMTEPSVPKESDVESTDVE
ncbi:MAG: S9 family peptidase [Thermoanaerobaculales bacterium]|jgi:dipeptidyl aminopeptidase/acylaminoacyl peptidase|nr:S9 family peptidase [Thermoanaerobaculales bacterium]